MLDSLKQLQRRERGELEKRSVRLCSRISPLRRMNTGNLGTAAIGSRLFLAAIFQLSCSSTGFDVEPENESLLYYIEGRAQLFQRTQLFNPASYGWIEIRRIGVDKAGRPLRILELSDRDDDQLIVLKQLFAHIRLREQRAGSAGMQQP